jgi:hypothetical protein
LAAMCDAPELAAGAGFPWNVPAAALSAGLREVLWHAQCFSELTVGPQHVYNVLLARKARNDFGWDTSDLEAAERRRLVTWAELVASRHDELRAWVDDLQGFWALLARFDTVRERTRDFVESMVTRAVADPVGFPEQVAVQDKIRFREVQLKAKRARLAHRSALENWNQAPFGEQLNYRWPITLSYLNDIAQAMGRSA